MEVNNIEIISLFLYHDRAFNKFTNICATKIM